MKLAQHILPGRSLQLETNLNVYKVWLDPETDTRMVSRKKHLLFVDCGRQLLQPPSSRWLRALYTYGRIIKFG
jgi:hypothetical protein